MDLSVECKEWLASFPKMNWRSTFSFLLAPETLKAVEFSDYGVACFAKGLQHEFNDKDYVEAFNCYENGAMQLDSLCLFRLHEIYMGDTNFKIEYNERQSVCHLLYSALISQFETFDSKVSFMGKLEAFWKKDPVRRDYLLEVLSNPPADYFTPVSSLFAKLFTFYNNKDTITEILPELKALQIDVIKGKFFSIINALFDFLAYTYNSGFSKVDLEKCVETILDMLTNDLLFDNFFQNYVTHLRLLRARKKFAFVFQRRIETDCFWIWSFSFLTSMKNHYLGVLASFEETFMNGSVILKWKNTESWINNFVGFCYEKGIGTGKSTDKGLEYYEKDLVQMPRVLFSRYRKLVCIKEKIAKGEQVDQEYQSGAKIDIESQDLKQKLEERLEDSNRMDCYLFYVYGKIYEKIAKGEQVDQEYQSGAKIDIESQDLKQKLEERLEDSNRMDCYLFYVYGKIYEKIDDDIDRALEWYQRGLDASTDSCLKNHLLCNESWRMRCKKRVLKLQASKGLQVSIVNKNRED